MKARERRIVEKLSVIIPVYNTKDDLRKCLDSIINQTYRQLEIVCVDDGSTDGSGEIVDEYAGKDDRIIAIHQENQGESAARNTGLKVSAGDCIAFCDCDDWIEPDMYETLMRVMAETGVDMAASGWYKETDGRSVEIVNEQPVSEGVFGREQLLKYLYIRDAYRGLAYMWNKLYRREILQDKAGRQLQFREDIQLGGDVIYLAEAALRVEKAIYINRAFYHYNQRRDSGCHTKDLKKLRDWVKAYEIVVDRFEEEKIGGEVMGYVKRFLAYHSCEGAEEAIRQQDRFYMHEFHGLMAAYEREYMELNRQYPERTGHYQRILNESKEGSKVQQQVRK